MKQFVRYYLRIKSKCMKVTYLFNFIILILLGSCISKELIKEANEKFVIDINRQDKITNFFNAYHTIALETTWRPTTSKAKGVSARQSPKIRASEAFLNERDTRTSARFTSALLNVKM